MSYEINCLEDERDKLYDALDVIVKYEDGDNVHLKTKIRNRIDEIEKLLEKIQ